MHVELSSIQSKLAKEEVYMSFCGGDISREDLSRICRYLEFVKSEHSEQLPPLKSISNRKLKWHENPKYDMDPHFPK